MKNYFREIPKVDKILEDEKIKLIIEKYSRKVVLDIISEITEKLRNKISIYLKSEKEIDELEKEIEISITNLITDIIYNVEALFEPNLKRVINATGTILHTNLGRALINKDIAYRLADIVSGYSNLEYNLKEGKRGERYDSFSNLICKITGAQAALAVNNNAAAVMLILNTLAKDGEVIVSRGELVEIGGKFRVPDVLRASGARLVEVGTTNKTHLSDYENAINENTKAILKVHTSNYNIIGFTENVSIASIKKNLPNTLVIEDLGSGVLVDLEKYGLKHEPTVMESINAGVDIVCFSGDKLFGGPQAGIIIGKKEYIDKIKKNQLTRAFRIDKFTVAALELVLMEYLKGDKVEESIPVLRMIKESYESVSKRAKVLFEKLKLADKNNNLILNLLDLKSQIGGGSLPGELISSRGISIKFKNISTSKAEEKLRNLNIPIIVRIVEDTILLDIRTVNSDDFDIIANSFGGLT